MPMFDDPKKELRRLQQELLAEEEEFDCEEEEYLTEDEWLEQELAEAKVLSGYQEPQEPVVRNYANGYGAKPDPWEAYGQRRSYMSGYSTYQQERPVYRPNVRNYADEEVYEEEEYEEEKSIRGLVVLAIALTLGIVAVAGYWVLVLL